MSTNQRKKLRRSSDDKIVAGVCGGLSKYTRLSTARYRLLFMLAGVAYGIGILLYLLLWFLIPADNAPQTKRTKP